MTLAGHAAGSNNIEVDKGVAGYDAKLFSNASVHDEHHAKLVLIEVWCGVRGVCVQHNVSTMQT